MFDWKWYLSDLKQDKDVRVFSTFSCGGGSTMGYKRAGFQVLGNVEIDPRMNRVYKKNHHPRFNYQMDLRQFNRLEALPGELYQLDILDGSPPCSTFSMAGQREKNWGREKAFREGQKKQVLDDLFFVFLDTVAKLRPKIVVAENVTGLITGKAKGYVNAILERFRGLGYAVQFFRLNAAFMNVPQARERVFFIANNQGYPKLILDFHGKPVTFGQCRTAHGIPINPEKARNTWQYLEHMRPTDRSIADIKMRLYGRRSNFNNRIFRDCDVSDTLTSGGQGIRACDKTWLSPGDCRNISSFPQDYDFCGENVRYICGMSVPPNMMANIAMEIYRQWLAQTG